MAINQIGAILGAAPGQANVLSAVKPNHRTMLITDEVNGLWEWNCSIPAGNGQDDQYNTFRRVIDYLPTVTSNAGVAGETASWCATNSKAPCGSYMTWFRGRVFLADPNTSRVYYSGTRLDLTVGIAPNQQPAWVTANAYYVGDEVINGGTRYICTANHTSSADFATDASKWSTTRPMKPWENWNVRMDLSRTNPAHGGNVVVGDTNERLNGLWATESGLIVFKERSIYLWSWSDSAAPHEVDRGAAITKISDGIGLVSHNTIDQIGGTIIFFGQDSNSNYGVFQLVDGVVSEMSKLVSRRFAELPRNRYDKPPAHGVIYNGWYYLAPQDKNNIPSLKFALDLKGGGMVTLSGLPTTSLSIYKPEGKLILVNPEDHKTYRYPNPGIHTDFGLNEIEWAVKTAKVIAADPFADKKFRIAWVNADSVTGDVLSSSEVEFLLLVEYDNGYEEHSGTITLNDTDPIILNHRAQEATMRISGTTSTGVRIKDLAIGWRKRKRKNVQD